MIKYYQNKCFKNHRNNKENGEIKYVWPYKELFILKHWIPELDSFIFSSTHFVFPLLLKESVWERFN